MGSQSNLLVDATIVEFIILNIADSFPFAAFHTIIPREIRIQRVKMDARHKDSPLIIEQIQRIGAKRNGRQPMRIATQCTDEIAVGHHLTDATVIFIKNRSTNHNAMLHRIGEIKLVFWAIDNSINV